MITVVGGGLVGSLLSSFLARRGHVVELHERRPDMRREAIGAGRSINLVVTTRGLNALKQVGLEEEVLKLAIPMRGRMMHAVDGKLTFQRYGRDDSECINSISRGALNQLLLTAAEKTGKVRTCFRSRAVGAELDEGVVHFRDEATGETVARKSELVIGTDGSASAIRNAMAETSGLRVDEDALDYGYKELTIPAGPGGDWQLEKNVLHIWPRGTYMLIALPNLDGSFTCTLFLPFEGPRGSVSFATLKTPEDVTQFFAVQFPDALRLIPDLAETFFANPTGHMVTVRCTPWNHGGKALLLGDAAHAIVPFFGQGMNCGFEDCTILGEMLDRDGDWNRAFSEFSVKRKKDSDAIADLAIENFLEMRDKVGNARFLLEKAVEQVLMARFPGEYVSRYSLVTFSLKPYSLAHRMGQVQADVLAELCQGISKAEDVDLHRAEKLIKARVAPILKGE